MKFPVFAILALILFSSSTPRAFEEEFKEGWEQADRILARINPPVFPENYFSISDYGASGDGSLCTEAFRMAIEDCHKAGGGTVIVPADTFVTGAIHLLSNVNLHLM
ncbi:MAG: glycoside hydrolase family 28 protein, partial [Bacteroidales bacterium]|nr:glycoside hydrolase family 28 protein [Bacteroidales bacterium]